MAVQGVLIDIDGTLVISNDAHAHAYVEAFAEQGYEIKFAAVRPLIGMGSDQVIPHMVAGLDGKKGIGKEIADRRKELIIKKYSSSLAPAPGSRDLIQRLKQDGFKLVVASSATREELSSLLKAAKVEDLLSEIPQTTADDAEASKPEPDLIEAALSKGQLQPEQAIMLGDTPYDIQAAAAAGVKVIAFRCGDFDDAQLADAIAIYNDPADLLQHYEESPLGQREAVSSK